MHYWHPTHCTLQLNFTRPSNSNESHTSLLTAGDNYTGTSVIRYVRRPLSTSEKTIISTNNNNNNNNNDGLHFHAITALSRTLPKAQPLVLHSIKVHSYPSNDNTPLKVIRVVEEDGEVYKDEPSSHHTGKGNNNNNSNSNSQRRGKTKEKKNHSKNEPQGGKGKEEEEDKSLQNDPGSKRVFFEGGDSFPSGSTVILTIAFTGIIQAWDQGGIYTNDKSETINISTAGIGSSLTHGVLLTHFEVSLARLAFPCPDDPQRYRLTWQIQSLQLPSPYTWVISNTPEIMKKSMGNKGTQYSFASIGPLPAYVLAFAAFSGSVEVVETTLHTRRALLTSVEDNNKCNTMGRRNYDDVESILPLRIITSKTSGVTLAMLNQIAYIAQESVRLLEDFFAAPLPLQQLPFSENYEHQEEMLTIVVAPTMPYISGMEHHSCIFLNEAVYRTSQNNNSNGSSGNSNSNNNIKGSSKQQHTTCSNEVSRVELIVHELAHHWVGNALGMPFVLKEGVCLLLEQCFADIIMGKPMRKIKPSGDTLSSTFITSAPSTSSTSSGTASSPTVSTATIVVDTEKGKEFTGYSYQKALNTLRDVVSGMGFSTFKERMQYMYFNEVMKNSENCSGEDFNSHLYVKDRITPYVTAEKFLAYMEA